MAESLAEHDSQWSAIRSVAEKLGCYPETLRAWIRRDERVTPSSSISRLRRRPISNPWAIDGEEAAAQDRRRP